MYVLDGFMFLQEEFICTRSRTVHYTGKAEQITFTVLGYELNLAAMVVGLGVIRGGLKRLYIKYTCDRRSNQWFIGDQ